MSKIDAKGTYTSTPERRFVERAKHTASGKDIDEALENAGKTYTAGTGINISSDDKISVNNDVAMKTDIPTVTEVVANPTLAGTEDELIGLQVGTTKYKVPSGGGSSTHLYLLTFVDINTKTNFSIVTRTPSNLNGINLNDEWNPSTITLTSAQKTALINSLKDAISNQYIDDENVTHNVSFLLLNAYKYSDDANASYGKLDVATHLDDSDLITNIVLNYRFEYKYGSSTIYKQGFDLYVNKGSEFETVSISTQIDTNLILILESQIL